MSGLIQAIVGVFEILVLGALIVLTAVYLIALFNPVRRWFKDYLKAVWSLVLPEKMRESDIVRVTLLVVGLGLIYYMGVVTNALAYWFLEPAHAKVIMSAYSHGREMTSESVAEKISSASATVCTTLTSTMICTTRVCSTDARTFVTSANVSGSTRGISVFSVAGTIFPRPREVPDSIRAHYVAYLYREVEWRNLELDVTKHALDHLLKYIRLIRGTVFCTYLIFWFAVLKVIIGSVVLLFSTSDRLIGPTEFLYEVFVHDRSSSVPLPISSKDQEAEKSTSRVKTMRSITGYRMIAPNIIIFVVAAVVFLSAIAAYKAVEYEYHYIVDSGHSTAIEKHWVKNRPSGPSRTKSNENTRPDSSQTTSQEAKSE